MASHRIPRWLLCTIILYALAFWLYTMYAYGLTDVDDRLTYLRAATDLAGLHSNAVRTPVYPALILITTRLLGYTAGLVTLTALQWCAWVGAMTLLWRIGLRIGLHRYAATAVLLAMMAVYDISMFNSVILPERLCVTSVITLLYLSLRYIDRPAQRTALLISALTVGMIFLKPIFVILIPIVAVLFLARMPYSSRRATYCGLAGMAVAILLVFGYMSQMKRIYGFHRMTAANLWNDYHLLRRHSLITPDDIDGPMHDVFQKWYDADPGRDEPDKAEYYNECCTFSTFELNDLVLRKKAQYADSIPPIVLHRFVYSLDYSLFWMRYMAYDWPKDDKYAGDMYFPFWLAMLIFAVYITLGLRRWVKDRRFPAALYMLPAIWAAMYVTSMVGAMDDWGRLMAPSLPCLWLMTAATADTLLRHARR